MTTSTREWPELHDLSLRAKAVVGTSRTVDLGMRTALASMVTGSMAVGAMATGKLRDEAANVEFYAALTAQADAAVTFPAPPGDVEVRSRRQPSVPRLLRGTARGQVNDLSMPSTYVPANEAVRAGYQGFVRNRTAWAQHWTHADGPRNTIIVSHGFMASPYLVNSAFFSLPWFYHQGYDVLLVTLPFHGRRKGRLDPYNGHGFMAHGPSYINEAMMQSVHDVRTWMNWLFERGVAKVGMTGISLGGHTTALVSAADDRLSFAIPNAAVTHTPSLVEGWFPLGGVAKLALDRFGSDWDDVAVSLESTSPLTYPCQVPKSGRFIIAGLGDLIAPPEQSRRLWVHWDKCQFHWYPGNHVLHVDRGRYLREMGRFLNASGFAA